MPLCYSLPVWVIAVNNSYSALFEQHSFTSHVFFKRCMLIWSNMIRLNIGKNAIVKNKALCSMHHQTLRRYFHDYCITAGFLHLFKVLLQRVGFRSCIIGRNDFITNNCFYRTYQSNLMSRIFKNGLYKIGCCCLALRSCYPDDLHIIRRISKICCRNKSHCVSGIRYTNHCYVTFC